MYVRPLPQVLSVQTVGQIIDKFSQQDEATQMLVSLISEAQTRVRIYIYIYLYIYVYVHVCIYVYIGCIYRLYTYRRVFVSAQARAHPVPFSQLRSGVCCVVLVVCLCV